MDTLNFSFWSGVAEEGSNASGIVPKVHGSFTAEDILRIFRSETDTTIPLVEDRVKNLKEAANVLMNKYEGSFVNCIKSCKNSAQELLKLMCMNLIQAF